MRLDLLSMLKPPGQFRTKRVTIGFKSTIYPPQDLRYRRHIFFADALCATRAGYLGRK